MRAYEAMYIIRPDFDEEKVKATMEKYSTLIQNNGGELGKVDLWGKRRLAYEVKKLHEGFYVLMKFNGQAEVPAELERNFKISDDVIRYLVVKEEE
ncbi:30S ribosomal protein S6 [Dehalobacterium formicoaceticum]|uniref:Small ribosomal subunit protein bS6 n=1 Tax=Dehalobacterium formicoaceticum TaxID=51515 RepID=A0ABT1Y3U7_9FIRM|nr:30S ribosomal protein S6 [Dehalobacterium formicoaceticum]MCR6545549.1 30S ribosomal protein S6 [Dehalobacterium formicoaceticum]